MNDNDLDTIFADDWPPDHRSGVVAVLGRPNVGKSTLINAILGEKIAIVTPTPQTTRKRQLGIYTEERGQILFVDTPGLHDPHHQFGEYMVKLARESLRDADLILLLLDVSQLPTNEDTAVAELVENLRTDTPVILALNKADLLTPENSETHVAAYTALLRHEKALLISALQRTGVDELLEDLLQRLPQGPRYYPAEQISEANMRYIAAEIIREKIILNTEDEIPHAAAVEIDSFQEYPDENLSEISAIIYVERDSQKGIVVGKDGSMIKRIGSQARTELEPLLDMQVYLDLRVKVLKNWRKNPDLMRRLGYRIPKQS